MREAMTPLETKLADALRARMPHLPGNAVGEWEDAREALAEYEREKAGQPAGVPQVNWQPIETAPKDGCPRLYLVKRCCLQGFVDATGVLMVQNEIPPHWRKMRSKPTHWMPLPEPPQ